MIHPGLPEDPDDEAAAGRIPEGNPTLPSQPGLPDAIPTSEHAAAMLPLSRGTIALLVLATFGGSIATLVPMAFSLALRVEQLTPGRPDLLGYLLAMSAGASLIATPLTGVLSDRTRSRWGRRRPYLVGGTLLGLASVPILVLAQDVVTLGIGWVLCSLGFGTAGASVRNFQADHLPKEQRGKVSGLTSLTMQVAPVIGILLAGRVAHDEMWLFLLPALVGGTCMLVFASSVHEPPSTKLVFPERLSLGRILRGYGFDPRTTPDFAWHWLGRFIVFAGLTLITSYTTFFYSQRLGLPVAEVATVLAATAALSIVSLSVGSLGAGWLSDRLGRRRPFIIAGAFVMACGCAVSALSWNLPALLLGSFLISLGIAVFTAVNNAIVLDILPHRNTQAGRFMAINMFSQRIPSVLAPLLAPLLLAVPGSPAADNFVALYIAAGVLLLAGAAVITGKVRGVA